MNNHRTPCYEDWQQINPCILRPQAKKLKLSDDLAITSLSPPPRPAQVTHILFYMIVCYICTDLSSFSIVFQPVTLTLHSAASLSSPISQPTFSVGFLTLMLTFVIVLSSIPPSGAAALLADAFRGVSAARPFSVGQEAARGTSSGNVRQSRNKV